MELIVTHVGADFDGFAAMIAAQRFHPEARLFFPGSREESLRRALADGLWAFSEIRRREVEPELLRRVILCDIRQRDRIGVVADWLARRPDLEVLAYDHHPSSSEDIPLTGGIVDSGVGAAATLMIEELARRGLETEPALATMLLLGIYEDTGALTYPTTHPRDLRAAARLLEAGADLAAVRRYAQRNLDAPHLAVLHRMVEEMEVHRLRGHRVGVVTLELGEYLEELAPLVSRCVELHALDVLVAIFGEGDRTTLIARGDVAGLHLGSLLGAFGGGGHATAASAAVRGLPLVEARERVLEALARQLPPLGTARELMVQSFVTVEVEDTVAEAKERMLRGRVNSAPVVESGAVVGSVSRQQLDIAMQHRMQARPVRAVMSSEVRWIEGSASVEEVAEALLRGGPAGRFVLVGDSATRRAEGLISRLALMSHLYSRLTAEGEALERRVGGERMRHRQVGRLLAERVRPATAARLDAIREVAERCEAAVYVVGGFVRDLLLGRPNEDIDLVVEGDGLQFARELARQLGGHTREHPEFLTAMVVDAEGIPIDVATARSEFYRAPAALPEVQTSVLRQDLYRRDFTINTLAIGLGRERSGQLLDFFGGVRDVEERSLRVLHSLSFVDDPTRIMRAIRFEARLGLHLTAETRRLAEVALDEGAFARLGGQRLREELVLLLEQIEELPRVVSRLAELRVLAAIHPGLLLDERLRQRLSRAASVSEWWRLSGMSHGRFEPWLLALFALAVELSADSRAELADRLGLAGGRRTRLVTFRDRLSAPASALSRADAHLPHEVAEQLEGLAIEELLFLMAESPESGQAAVRRFLSDWRGFRPLLRGRDLIAAGWPSGPEIGKALRVVWAARLDGQIAESEELDLAISRLGPRDRSVEREARNEKEGR